MLTAKVNQTYPQTHERPPPGGEGAGVARRLGGGNPARRGSGC